MLADSGKPGGAFGNLGCQVQRRILMDRVLAFASPLRRLFRTAAKCTIVVNTIDGSVVLFLRSLESAKFSTFPAQPNTPNWGRRFKSPPARLPNTPVVSSLVDSVFYEGDLQARCASSEKRFFWALLLFEFLVHPRDEQHVPQTSLNGAGSGENNSSAKRSRMTPTPSSSRVSRSRNSARIRFIRSRSAAS